MTWSSLHCKNHHTWVTVMLNNLLERDMETSISYSQHTEAKEQPWNVISTPDILCMLVSKLPNGLIDMWNRTAYNIRKRQECEPSLSDLIKYVDQEATLVNNLMFSREALEYYSEESERYRSVKSLAIETKISDCPFYSATHDIEECDELKKLSVNERCSLL